VIFRRIELENFGIFYGTQALDLDRGLYVLHGENGRGKTTIINAVKWVFFGSFENRQGQTVDPDLILNIEAKQEGKRKFSVTLTMEEDEGTEILVRQTCESSSGWKTSLYVERDGRALNEAEARHLLSNLLDKRISRFFLFDGEQLDEYEKLLFEGEESAQLVKSSIEQILGVPVLENAIEDLSQVAADIGKKISKAARLNDKTKQQAFQAQQIEEEIEAAEADLADLEKLRAEAEGEIDAADTVLQKYEASQEVVKQIEAVEKEIADIEAAREAIAAERSVALAGSWRDALSIAVEPLRASIEGQWAAQAKQAQDEQLVEQLERSLEQGSCDLCDHELDVTVEKALKERLEAVNGSKPQDLPKIEVGALALAAIAETGDLARAERFDERISERETEAAGKQQELKMIRESAKESPSPDVRAAVGRRDKAVGDAAKIDDRIEKKKAAIAAQQQTVKDIVQGIAEGDGSEELASLKEKGQLADDLKLLCEAAKSRFRDELRDQVEHDASAIFRELTTEPSHAGLRINESYGLETVGPGDEVVPSRSAGQEQVVALSLIGALNRNAARRAPVMMDTPFGRLDPGHRKKVLEFLAGMAEQVFLLVHEGEVDAADLGKIAADIKQEFDLERESLYHTELLPRSGGSR
jgi:DNA sulfur modification protein DndD